MSDFEDLWWYDMCDIPWTHDWCEEQFRTAPILSLDRKKISHIEYCIHCWSTNVKISKAWKKYCWDICWKNNWKNSWFI